MRILALDTATEALSVALCCDGELIVRESRPARGHGEWLLPMVDEVLAEAGIGLGALDALAVGRGPGAFTGVRIAVSVAQGLAFGAGLGIVPVSDLAALALGAARRAEAEQRASLPVLVLACLDARLGGLYAAGFAVEAAAHGLAAVENYLESRDVLTTGAQCPLDGPRPVLVAGHGWRAGGALPARVGDRLRACYADLLPSAADVARLAVPLLGRGAAVDAQALTPLYLRDEVATRSVRGVGAPR